MHDWFARLAVYKFPTRGRLFLADVLANTPHVRSRTEERRTKKRYPPRRWVVEVAHSWFNRFRKLLVRYEKTHRSFMALNMLAAAIISFRHVPARVNIIYG
jgi:transposase